MKIFGCKLKTGFVLYALFSIYLVFNFYQTVYFKAAEAYESITLTLSFFLAFIVGSGISLIVLNLIFLTISRFTKADMYKKSFSGVAKEFFLDCKNDFDGSKAQALLMISFAAFSFLLWLIFIFNSGISYYRSANVISYRSSQDALFVKTETGREYRVCSNSYENLNKFKSKRNIPYVKELYLKNTYIGDKDTCVDLYIKTILPEIKESKPAYLE